MIATRGTTRRAVLSFARQTCLSILGTLAGTVVLAQLKAEWSPRSAAPSVAMRPTAEPALPSLTRGGKFAARALDGDTPDAFETLTALPPILPLFTALTVPRLDLASPEAATETASAAAVDTAPLLDVPSPRPATRRAVRRVAAALPLQHTAGPVIAMAALPELPQIVPDEQSLWSRSKAAYHQVAGWSGTLVDTLLP